METLGERIRAARKARGWSQLQLSLELCTAGGRVYHSQVCDWESGKRRPAATNQKLLRAVLGIEVDRKEDRGRWTMTGRIDVRNEIDKRRGRQSRADYMATVLGIEVDDPRRRGERS